MENRLGHGRFLSPVTIRGPNLEILSACRLPLAFGAIRNGCSDTQNRLQRPAYAVPFCWDELLHWPFGDLEFWGGGVSARLLPDGRAQAIESDGQEIGDSGGCRSSGNQPRAILPALNWRCIGFAQGMIADATWQVAAIL
jgi:hypothetical protein